jgi:hypothetical protein
MVLRPPGSAHISLTRVAHSNPDRHPPSRPLPPPRPPPTARNSHAPLDKRLSISDNARRRTASAPCPACRVGGSLTLTAQRELARRTARTAGPSRALWYLVRKSSNDGCPVLRAGIPHHPLWTIRRARSRLGYRMVTTGAPRALRRHTKQVMPRGRRGVTMTRLPTVGRNELRLIRVGRFPRCYTLNAPLVLGAALAPAFVGTFVGLVRSSPAGPGRPRSRDSAPSSPSRWDCCRPPSSRRRSRTGVSDPDGSVAPPPADVGVSGEVTR